MLSQPTTDQLLDGIQSDLAATVIPALPEGPAKVMAQMMQQIIRGAAVRAAHEIAWMHEEIAEIEAAASRYDADPVVADARAQLAAADAMSLHLADVQQRYSLAGEVLSCAFEVAYREGDAAGIEELRAVLQRRSDREMQIIGTLDLVGRG